MKEFTPQNQLAKSPSEGSHLVSVPQSMKGGYHWPSTSELQERQQLRAHVQRKQNMDSPRHYPTIGIPSTVSSVHGGKTPTQVGLLFGTPKSAGFGSLEEEKEKTNKGKLLGANSKPQQAPDPTNADNNHDSVAVENKDSFETERNDEAPVSLNVNPKDDDKKKKEKHPKLKHKTLKSAPNGKSDKRKEVGVGERVQFDSDKEGNWTATSGTPAAQAGGKVYIWKAPNRAGNATIKLVVGEFEITRNFEIIEPDRITTDKVSEIPYPAGSQGAGMKLKFKYHPMSVNLTNVETKEVSGPASSISGYFTRFAAAALRHASGDAFFAIGPNNRDTATDEASGSGYPKPWKRGYFEWNIPNHFRVIGEAGDGKLFHTMTQSFSFHKSGRTVIRKGGSHVSRTP